MLLIVMLGLSKWKPWFAKLMMFNDLNEVVSDCVTLQFCFVKKVIK